MGEGAASGRASLEVEATRMELVARWADDLAHEIKNPLHAMVINLELVKRWAAGADPVSVVERAEVVEAELHRVHGLMESLLRIIRPWPEKGAVDADGVFRMLHPAIAARAGIRKLEYEHESGAGVVAMAPGHFALVVLSLVDNAIDATPPGGRVATRCEVQDRRVRITVRDTGSGVADELGDRVAESGVSTREDRRGLGLAITDRLVREAGGEWSLEPAADGAGTVATLLLPRSGSA